MSQRNLLECFEELTNDLPSSSEESLPVESALTPAAQSEVKIERPASSRSFPSDPDFREEKHSVLGRKEMVSGRSSKSKKATGGLNTGIAGPRKQASITQLNSQKRIKAEDIHSSDTKAEIISNASAAQLVCCPTAHSASITPGDDRISEACSTILSTSTGIAGATHERQISKPYKLQVAQQGAIGTEGDFVDVDDNDDVSDWFANLDDQDLMQLENFEDGQDNG